MIDVVIGECHLDIRRTGSGAPWLADDDHRALAQRVQRIVVPMIEELLAPRVAQDSALPPLPTLDLRLSLTEADLAGAAPLGRTELRGRLARAAELGLAEAVRAARVAPDTLSLPRTEPTIAPDPAQPRPPPVLELDLARYLERVLAGRGAALTLLTLDELVALLSRAVEGVGTTESASSSREPLPHPMPAEALTDPGAPTRSAVLDALVAVSRLLASRSTSVALAESDVSSAMSAARNVLRRWHGKRCAESRDRPLDAPVEHVAAGAHTAQAPSEPDAEPRGALTPRAAAESRLREIPAPAPHLVPGRYALDHALPFLALAALTRHGVCDALALDAGEPSVLRTLLAAVALKCLPPDRSRGPGAWPASARRAAALAAGCTEPPSGAQFVAAIGRLPANGRFARAVIAAALADSLQTHGALPLVAAGERLALFDPDGLYPVVAGSADELAPFLRTLGRTLFLVSEDPGVFTSLEAVELRVIGEGPAVAGERATPVAGPGGWRGRATRSTPLHDSLRARLPAAAATAARAADVWQALAVDAPLVATTTVDRRTRLLEELAALLAGFALADLGWALYTRDAASWREPDPLLVSQRFADLSGWLDVDARQMTVVLPLGRRFGDLRDAGLLETVRPARDHRRLAFSGS